MSLKDTPAEGQPHQHSLARVEGAFQDHVLGQIPTCQLGALRGTCTAWRDLIDAAPITLLLPAAKDLIPAAVLAVLRTSLDLQLALRQQGHIMRNMHAGSMRLHVLPSSPASLEQCTRWSQWSPADGHQWLTADGLPAKVPTCKGLIVFPGHISALINTKTWQEELPKRLVGSQSFPAAWTAWKQVPRMGPLVSSWGSL